MWWWTTAALAALPALPALPFCHRGASEWKCQPLYAAGTAIQLALVTKWILQMNIYELFVSHSTGGGGGGGGSHQREREREREKEREKEKIVELNWMLNGII